MNIKYRSEITDYVLWPLCLSLPSINTILAIGRWYLGCCWCLAWYQLGQKNYQYSFPYGEKYDIAYGNSQFASILTSGLPVVIGTVLILAFARQSTFVAKLLSFKPLLGVGIISYSLYLCHQLLFVFGHLHFGIEAMTGWHYLPLSCLVMVLSVMSWFLLNNPSARKSKPTTGAGCLKPPLLEACS